MIEWKGLYANTPYSSANNKTQDDAVVGMQDTIYVTGPGYGGYSANVRIHNSSGAVVALIPVCGGGGALSAPAPARILDDSTTYSYSLEVVRGAVPSDDADKIAIRIVGGASKRYPGQGSTLADGSTSFAAPLRVAGGVAVGASAQSAGGRLRIPLNRRLRVGSFSDSTNNGYTPGDGQPALMDLEAIADPIPVTGTSTRSMATGLQQISWFFPVDWVTNGGVNGETSIQAVSRSTQTPSATRKAMTDVGAKNLDVLIINGFSVNDLTGLDVGSDIGGTVAAMIANQKRALDHFSPRVTYILFTGIYGAENASWSEAKGDAVRSAIVLSWAECAKLCAQYPNVIFLSPDGLLSDKGRWLPGVNTETGTRVHLSSYGGALLARAQRDILDQLFDIANCDEVAADVTDSWFSPVGSAPTVRPPNTNSSPAGGGSAVLGASTVTNGVWRQKITTTGNLVECALLTLKPLKTLLAGRVAGDRFYVEWDMDCLDEAGNKIPFRARKTEALYEITNTAYRFVTMGDSLVDAARLSGPTIRLDRNASALGTSSDVQARIYPDRVGETTIVIYPPRIRMAPAPKPAIRELYASPHEGTTSMSTKDVLTEFARYNISAQDALMWARDRKLIEEQFMLGVNLANVDNTINFICKWNGVTVVDGVYVRPALAGAPEFAAGQNKVLDFTNTMRIQAFAGTVASPRNHVRWRTTFNGAADFGSLEEYSWGQNQVDLANGVEVIWYYYIQGTGTPQIYYDHLRVTM